MSRSIIEVINDFSTTEWRQIQTIDILIILISNWVKILSFCHFYDVDLIANSVITFSDI